MNILCQLGLHRIYRADVTFPSFRKPGKTETVCAKLCRRCSYVDPIMTIGGFPGEVLGSIR